jgi:hypothetical protein
MYNSMVKHMGSPSFGKTDFWAGQRPRRDQYSQFVDKAKARFLNHLKDPFQLADLPPITISGWNYAGQKEPGDAQIPYRFTEDELKQYQLLSTQKAGIFMTTCKTKELCQNLLDLLALDHRYLIICDALPNNIKEPIAEPEEPSMTQPVLGAATHDGGNHDDDSDPDKRAASPNPSAALSPPEKSQDDNFRLWMALRPTSVPWDDLRFSDDDAPDRKNFMPACAFFFYIPELPVKFPDVNNALHKHWLTKYKTPMTAAAFDVAPISFDDAETEWFKANIELMISKLSEAEREVRGLRPGTARTKGMMQAKAQAAALAKAKATQAGKKRGLDAVDGGTSSESELEQASKAGRYTLNATYT